MNDFKNIRYEEYCQLRKDIRGSREYLIVAIDVAKDTHHAFFGMPTGKTLLRRLVFENNIKGFEKLHTHVKALKLRNSLSKIVFGVEPTGHYHKPLAVHLIRVARGSRKGTLMKICVA